MAAITLVFASCASVQRANIDEPEISRALAMNEGQASSGDLSPGRSPSGQIHLFGEIHGYEEHTKLQFYLWHDFYNNENMRHLFVELPYYTAEFLNIWMKEDDDLIFDAIFDDLRGTAIHTPANMEFFRRIKKELPHTLFHGTDIGHHSSTTGQRFLQYLRQNGRENSEQYRLAEEAIEQGRLFYEELGQNHSMRVEMMVENFMREFDRLNGESIMSAFYGASHVNLGNYPSILGGSTTMASRLQRSYDGKIHTRDLRLPLVQYAAGVPDTLTVAGIEYSAMYYGEQDLRSRSDIFLKREFWRLEDAYDHFRDNPVSGDILPFNNYPMQVTRGQVFAILYTQRNGNTIMIYHRASGTRWQNMEATEEFLLE